MKKKLNVNCINSDGWLHFIKDSLKWWVISIAVIDFILRVVLLFNQQTKIAFGFLDWVNIFLTGFINDIAVAYVLSIFFFVYLITLFNKKYSSPWKYIIGGGLLATLVYVTCFHTVFDEYGSAVPKIVKWIFIYKVFSYGIRYFVPRVRYVWSYIVFSLLLFVSFLALLISASGEYFFWSEFGVRYNFIAVDYLIYTHEVIGNILESYAIVPLFLVLGIGAASLTWFFIKREFRLFGHYPCIAKKGSFCVVYIAIFLVACLHLSMAPKYENSSDVFVNELQANGINKFVRAFMDNKLNYKDFYLVLPEKQAVGIINNMYKSKDIHNTHIITSRAPEMHKNIILITEESLSASYLSRYGNKDNLTPNMDRLMKEGIAFDNLFATGNRTVRGLEALTLSLPPSPGESIIKQTDNANLFSVGKVLRQKGYVTQFLYGGKAYFDNMYAFYHGNGYTVVDESSIKSDKVHFSNIWGVCDEDIFTKAIELMRTNATSKKPVFLHIMTVSNHRPFTYPERRIDVSPKLKSRKGGVKYADYAIGKFIAEASKEPWFKNTLIVIVADHCASSAGDTKIPLDKYRIPAVVYAPGFIQPKSIDKISSQIDIMPTVFGLLHFSYVSRFYGEDILQPGYKPRAMMATYQDLGYLEGDRLVVLSAGRKFEEYKVFSQKDNNYIEKKINAGYTSSLVKAIAYYQTASIRRN